MIDKIYEIAKKYVEFPETPLDSIMNLNLFEIGLDSFNTILMIVELEQVYDFKLPDEFLTLENMETLDEIFKIIKALANKNKKEMI